ncbi:hybrid sensor histidine kinase/response regulator [Pseudomonas oryzae]|uniref:histidine kinase n=1 Tax=Pseudomonas oryzae TaxID=1392877 RepID=A0A1H1QSY4_9PSED|nr:ATP-binding protein [Pseudomonas oryzae]SDS26580.1 Signal transduction histidine kinase [Pseudomonas oryzae]
MHANGPQRIVNIRRDYNGWVADETREDYALRYTPKSFRKWSEGRIANTALGTLSFLVLEAIGATLVLNYGFTNSLLAILAMSLVIFLTGLPISYYAARHGIDMDLLTRAAGFGYIGSTITSLIYASFTFLFFALEAAVMAVALQMYFTIPLGLAYVVSALVVIPLAMYGITRISRLQAWTQPLWLILLLLPFAAVLLGNPGLPGELMEFVGKRADNGFDLVSFGLACTLVLALVTQIGEQVDYLRFLPAQTRANRGRWWAALLLAGPGWIVPGALKMLGGALLAVLALQHDVSPEHAAEPAQLYRVAYQYVFADPRWAMAAMVLLVVVSQVKINVTNAYAGSLAWSNFFARITHSHPGRVVWLVFNVGIALMLMVLGVVEAIEQVLGLYANVAIAWIGAMVADLVINKPLGLSPRLIEFKRAYLHDINPVGVGAMLLASLLSIIAYAGAFGVEAQALAPVIALGTALLAAPLLAWFTKGRYYIARAHQSELLLPHNQQGKVECGVCGNAYEEPDMAWCPAYGAPICSLCCSLDARCGDQCKPRVPLLERFEAGLARLLPGVAVPRLHTRLLHYLLVFGLMIVLTAGAMALVYGQVSHGLEQNPADAARTLQQGFLKAFLILALFVGVLAWWVVLNRESRRVALEESNRQTRLLIQEIDAHRETDAQLQKAKEAAEAASAAKSRYVTGLSHELRTPLNSILGYTQILRRDTGLGERHQDALATIHRSGDHLLSLIDGLLDVARIEAGKLNLEPCEIDFAEFVDQLAKMCALQAGEKGLAFHLERAGHMPAVVRGDEKRLRQILINLLGNAVRYTEHGSVTLRVGYLRQTATFEILDTGIGMHAEQLERLFQPFERGDPTREDHGLGLGLTIARMLSVLMGGELTVSSEPGQGTRFQLRLYLPAVRVPQALLAEEHDIVGYRGPRRRILVVDDHVEHRKVLAGLLEPLGFEIAMAASGQEALSQVSLLNPDLILMDLSMPQMDGWQTSRLIRQSVGSQAPIIVVSANAFADEGERRLDPACNDYLAKPVHGPALLEKIRQHLGLDWLRRESAAPAPPRELDLPAQALAELGELAALGYVRGVIERLDCLEREEPDCAAVIERLRGLARRFQLDELARCLAQATPRAAQPPMESSQ